MRKTGVDPKCLFGGGGHFIYYEYVFNTIEPEF